MLAQELKRLGRNVLIYGGGDALVRFINFLLLPLFTRYLTPNDYGVRGLLLALTAVLSPIFSLGLSAAVGPCYFEGNQLERKAATVWTACGLLAFSSVLMLFVGYAFSGAICRLVFQSADYAGLWRVTLWTTALAILSEPFNLYLRFEEKARLVVVISVTSALATIGASFLLVVVLRRGVWGLVMAGLVGRVVMLAMQVGPAVAALPLRWVRSLVKPLLALGIPLIPSFAWLYIIQQAGKYILQWKWGLDAVGLYQIGLSISGFAGLAVSAFQSAWYPFFMSFMDRQEEAVPVFSHTLTLYVFAACLLTAGFFAFAKPVLLVMTQPAFHSAFRVVGLSAAALFCVGLYYVLLPPMYFAREVQAQALIQAVAAIASLALNWWLIAVWGVMGAATSFLLGFALFVPLTVAWNRIRRSRYMPLNIEWRRLGVMVGATSALAALTLAPRNWSLPAELALAAAVMAAAAGCAWWMLNGNERRQLMALARRRATTGAA